MKSQFSAQKQRTCLCRRKFHTFSNYSPPITTKDYVYYLFAITCSTYSPCCITLHIATTLQNNLLLRSSAGIQIQGAAASHCFLQEIPESKDLSAACAPLLPCSQDCPAPTVCPPLMRHEVTQGCVTLSPNSHSGCCLPHR